MTFNTDDLQSQPDFYYKIPDGGVVKTNTNKRYKFFRQNHFTAGDYEQFLQYWDRSSPSWHPNPTPETLQHVHPNCFLGLYKDLKDVNVFQTFEYLFNKFKKGIFLKATDGVPKVFLPFSKVDYKNDWASTIKIDTKKYRDVTDLMRYIGQQESREFFESRVHKDTNCWYGNNGLVRLEFPPSEGDTGVNMMRDMFVSLFSERTLQGSCEVFINKRDFPLVKKNSTEAYESFYGENCPLGSFPLKKFAPILSMTTSDEHADIPIPTWEDWCRVSFWEDGKKFGKDFREFPSVEEMGKIPWEERMETAVFRGASTGLGTTVKNNPRLYFSMLSEQKKRDEDGVLFLDVGISKWNFRPRKIKPYDFLETIRLEEMPFGISSFISPLEQTQYKYILHLPGHSFAYRLSMELFSGSVILMYPTKYKIWYSDQLQPYVHYVPINDKDPLDIYKKIKWCKEHDDQCKKIAQQAKAFAISHLSRKGILDYLERTLLVLNAQNGNIMHCKNSLETFILQKEQFFLQQVSTTMNHTILPEIIQAFVDEKINLDSLSRPFVSFLLWNGMTEMEILEKSIKQGVDVMKIGSKFFIKKKLHISPHELAISFMHINTLALQFPNFVYTFAGTKDFGYSYTEFIQGMTLEEMITKKNFSIPQILHVLKIICLALLEAQNQCGFMHMDLYPWNIIIQSTSTPQTFTYSIGGGEYVQVETTEIPIFIDYGRSHVVYEGRNFYNVSPFRISKLQDIISIVFSTFHSILLHHKLTFENVKVVLELFKFFANTPYMPSNMVQNITNLKTFLRSKKKFSNMLIDSKDGLENTSPLDFFHYLSKLSPSTGFTIIKKPVTINYGNIFSMSLPFCTPVSFQMNLLEIRSHIPHLAVFIRSIVLQIYHQIEFIFHEPITFKNQLHLLICRDFLLQLKDEKVMEEEIRLWIEEMLGEIENFCTTHPPIIHEVFIPLDSEVRPIPLFSCHPFYSKKEEQDSFHIHFYSSQWLEMYCQFIFTHPVMKSTQRFDFFTKSFRNSWMKEYQ